mgnify:CR=1 FL=1
MQHPRRLRDDRGIAIITTALLLVPMMIFAAFGVDLASWYSRISYLQKSADAAALAGTVWMPNEAKATQVACESLAKNGISGSPDCGTGPFEVTVVGIGTSTLRVTVTDPSAARYFSQVVSGGNQRLTRSAEAEYNLPIPLGSPLNYFGGDATRTAQPSVTTYSVTWPTDYTTRVPMNAPCNIGTSSGQGLGAWSGGGSPSFDAGDFDSGDPQCRWGSSGSQVAGTSAVPPPDYTTRPANNPTCRVRQNGVSTGTILGRWRSSGFTSTAGSGSPPMCVWNNYATDVSTILPDATTRPPTNRPCKVGYETSGPGGGWWSSGGVYSATSPSPPTGRSSSSGNRLCEWGPDIATNTVTPPNPIDPTRSPGFWAMIEGPGSVAPNGDIYNTRCYIDNLCGSVQNAQYKPPSDPDRGFWYVVKMPNVALGSVDINVFDASYNPNGDTQTNAGDRNLGSSAVFPTEFRVYQQTNPLDFSLRTPIGGATGNQTEGSCHWTLGNEGAFQAAWKRLCTLTAPAAGATYLVQVQTTGTAGNGINGYAIEAVAGGGSGTQPALYAYSNMGMQNNNDGSPPPPATFYLAEVGPQYAGRTLVIDLWDPGDASGNASLFPKMPSTSAPKPVVDVPVSACSYTSSPAPNAVQSGSAGGSTGLTYSTPQGSDFGTRCGIRSTISGARQFNGTWLTIRVDIPSSYTCTLGINPETTAGSCWWGIEYNFSAAANDVTTWQARIEGNPVQLTA